MKNLFGQKIREVLKSQGLKQSDLAKLLKTSPQNITALLNQANPNLTTMNKVASVLNLDLTTFNNNDLDLNRDHNLELIKKVESTEFRDLGEGRFLIMPPLVSSKHWNSYAWRQRDAGYIAELPRHAISTDKLFFGKYRSFEVQENLIFEEQNVKILAGNILTGIKWEGSNYLYIKDELSASLCILVLTNQIFATGFLDYDPIDGNLICANPGLEGEENINIPADDVIEIYEISNITQYRFI